GGKQRLRILWALHGTGELADADKMLGFADKDPYVRAWRIQLRLENRQATPSLLDNLTKLARRDPSPLVRLYLASALQRLTLTERWRILEELLDHDEDASDHNLPFMYWYALEPLTDVDAGKALELALQAKVPRVLEFMARRQSSSTKPGANQLLVKRLAETHVEAQQLAMVRGMLEG